MKGRNAAFLRRRAAAAGRNPGRARPRALRGHDPRAGRADPDGLHGGAAFCKHAAVRLCGGKRAAYAGMADAFLRSRTGLLLPFRTPIPRIQSTSFPHKTGGFCIVSHNSVDESRGFPADFTNRRIRPRNRGKPAKPPIPPDRGGAAYGTEIAPRTADGADPLLPDITHSHQPFKVGVTALVRARVSTLTELPCACRPRPGRSRRNGNRAAQTPAPAAHAPPADCRSARAARLSARNEPWAVWRYARRSGPQGAEPIAVRAAARLRKPRGSCGKAFDEQLEAFFQKRLFTEEEFTLLDSSQALAAFFASELGAWRA